MIRNYLRGLGVKWCILRVFVVNRCRWMKWCDMWDLQSNSGVGKVDRDRNETRLARNWFLLKLGDGYIRFIMLLFIFLYVAKF